VTTLFGCGTVTATKEGAGVVLLVMMMNGLGVGWMGLMAGGGAGKKFPFFEEA
jgi:hypothetical protein